MKETEAVLREEEKVVFAFRKLYSRYGYAPYQMSKFEEYGLYAENRNFLMSDHIITFTDPNGKLMALKPDVTLSIVKNSKVPPMEVQKVYYDERVYRVRKGELSFRELPQVGLECLGAVGQYECSEVLTLAAKSLDCISEKYVLELSHLGILSAILEPLRLSSEVRSELLQCIGAKNKHGISELRETGRIDPNTAMRLQTLIASYGPPETVFQQLDTILQTPEERTYAKELQTVCRGLQSEFGNRLQVDFSVVNDLSYYNGIVFKGFVNGIPRAVLTGGQYDKLMQKLGKNGQGIGFAIDLSLLGELFSENTEYDADVLLLYDADADPDRLRTAVNNLIQSGNSVLACGKKPSKKRFRKVLQLTEKGVESIENHA